VVVGFPPVGGGEKEGVKEGVEGEAEGGVGIRGSTEGMLGFLSVERVEGEGFKEGVPSLGGTGGRVEVGVGVGVGAGVGLGGVGNFESTFLGSILADESVILFMNFFY